MVTTWKVVVLIGSEVVSVEDKVAVLVTETVGAAVITVLTIIRIVDVTVVGVFCLFSWSERIGGSCIIGTALLGCIRSALGVRRIVRFCCAGEEVTVSVSVFRPFAGSVSVTILVTVARIVDVNGSPTYVVIVLVMYRVENTVGGRFGVACLASRPSSCVREDLLSVKSSDSFRCSSSLPPF